MSHNGDSSSFVEEPPSPSARDRDLERQVLSLQYRLNTQQNESELMKLSLERELASFNSKYKQCMTELDSALKDTKYLYEQNSVLEQKLKEEREKSCDNEVVRQLEASNMELSHQLRLKDQSLEEMSNQYKSTVSLYENKVKNLELELKGKKSLLVKYEQEIGKQSERVMQLNKECVDKDDEISVLKVSEVVMAHRNYNTEELQELTILNKTLKDQMTLSKELERANLEQANELKKLRQKNESHQFLKLENSKLRSKLEQMDMMERKLEDLQLENVQLQEKLTNWELYQTEGSSPQDVIRELKLLKQESLTLVNDMGKLQIDLNNMKILNDELALERNQLLDLNKKYETSILNLKKLNYEIEQQKLLSFEESKLLRQQLEELSEIDRNPNSDEDNNKKQIRSLVENYKNQTEDLTNELKKLNEELLKQNDFSPSANRKKRKASDDLALNYSQRLNELQFKNKHLERKLANSEETAHLLEDKLRKLQSLNEKKIRILQLRNNPLLTDQFVKKKQLKLLQNENGALLKQLGGQGTVEAIPRSVYDRLQFDIQEMERELFSTNKRTTRLREMFNSKSLEFIDAVNSLLGFKLEFQVGGKVKMIPCYKTDKYLVADLQTNTLKSNLDKVIPNWDNLLTEYVEKKGQLPCFLAKIMLILAEQIHN